MHPALYNIERGGGGGGRSEGLKGPVARAGGLQGGAHSGSHGGSGDSGGHGGAGSLGSHGRARSLGGHGGLGASDGHGGSGADRVYGPPQNLLRWLAGRVVLIKRRPSGVLGKCKLSGALEKR